MQLHVLRKHAEAICNVLASEYAITAKILEGSSTKTNVELDLANVTPQHIRELLITLVTEGTPYYTEFERPGNIILIDGNFYDERGRCLPFAFSSQELTFTIGDIDALLSKENALEEIHKLVDGRKRRTTIPPWDNQEEYAKRYLINKLVGGM